MSARDLRSAISTFRIEGELVERADGAISVRRGGSVYEVLRDDVVDVQELEGKAVRVTVKSSAQLARTSLVAAQWQGAAIGWRPIFDDCAECCDCTDCSDCTECSVCSDCTECSVCADCTECSGIGGFGGGGFSPFQGAQSSWIRRAGNKLRGSKRR